MKVYKVVNLFLPGWLCLRPFQGFLHKWRRNLCRLRLHNLSLCWAPEAFKSGEIYILSHAVTRCNAFGYLINIVAFYERKRILRRISYPDPHGIRKCNNVLSVGDPLWLKIKMSSSICKGTVNPNTSFKASFLLNINLSYIHDFHLIVIAHQLKWYC